MGDFKSLLPNEQISDIVIDSYLELLNNSQEAQNKNFKFVDIAVIQTILYADQNLNFNIQNYNKVYFPLNLSNYHWILFVVDNQKNTIFYYDSLQYDKYNGLIELFKEKLPILENYKSRYTKANVAKQERGVDCGVFVMGYCYKLLKDEPLYFVKNSRNLLKTLRNWRTIIGNSIIQKTILPLNE